MNRWEDWLGVTHHLENRHHRARSPMRSAGTQLPQGHRTLAWDPNQCLLLPGTRPAGSNIIRWIYWHFIFKTTQSTFLTYEIVNSKCRQLKQLTGYWYCDAPVHRHPTSVWNCTRRIILLRDIIVTGVLMVVESTIYCTGSKYLIYQNVLSMS